MGFDGYHASYPGDRGFSVDFNSNNTLTTKKLAKLKRNNWID